MDRRLIGGKWLVYTLIAASIVSLFNLPRSSAQTTAPAASRPIAAVGSEVNATSSSAIELKVTPRIDTIDMEWTNEVAGVAHFKVQRSDHDADDWADIKTVGPKILKFTDSDVHGGNTYDYRIAALDPSGREIAFSATLSATLDKNLLQALKGNATLTVQDLRAFQFWQQSVNDLVLGALAFIPKLIAALILYGIFWLTYRMVRRIVVGSMSKAHVDSSIRDMLGALIKYSILGFGLVVACGQIGIEIAALLTGVSIIGLAIGLSAQETLANFIAGVVIFWDKPFKVGDWIIIDGTFGKVLRVSFRSTRMLDLGGETIVFPNTYMLASRVANHSTHPHIRVEVPIGIAYKESIDKARTALLQTTEDDPRICAKPAAQVVVAECGDSSVNLLLRLWITDASSEKNVFNEYLEKAKKALDAAHIEIPFPHMQLFLESTEAIKTLGGNTRPASN